MLNADDTWGDTSSPRDLTVAVAIDTSAGSGQLRNQSMVQPDKSPAGQGVGRGTFHTVVTEKGW